ncbi:MAG: ArsR family transcriptional regulator [Alphaproteobacteria bacterium]|nr:MAG: ArsR family transcriptional regulator [Alphaproteobacteria bacterium]
MSGAELDGIVHQPLRLKIMAALAALPEGEMVPFTRLKKISQASDGNLSHQLKVLSEAGYVTIAKDFHDNRPRTRVALTTIGRQAFDEHVASLRALLGDL